MNEPWAFSGLPPAERALLQAAARDLARRPVEEQVDDLEVLVVQSRDQRFALPLSSVLSVGELQSLAAVPRAPQAIRGLVSVRGEVMLAVELASLAGAGEAGLSDLKRVVVVGSGVQRLAVLTERILSVQATSSTRFAPAGPGLAFVTGVDAELRSLIDAEALVSHVFSLLEGA